MVKDCKQGWPPEPFNPEILYEDNHLLIVSKPAGMLTQADASGEVSLLEHLKHFIKLRDHKPGNVFLGLVQRIDRPVSGGIVFAKTSKAAARLSAQIRARQMIKCYLAITAARPDRQYGEINKTGVWQVVEHELSRVADKTRVDNAGGAAQKATLRLQTLLDNGTMGIHAVQLITGRKHQIRAQLAALEMPISGDEKYGSTTKVSGGKILLHSYLIRLKHPTRKTDLQVVADPPEDFFSGFTAEERTLIRASLNQLGI